MSLYCYLLIKISRSLTRVNCYCVVLSRNFAGPLHWIRFAYREPSRGGQQAQWNHPFLSSTVDYPAAARSVIQLAHRNHSTAAGLGHQQRSLLYSISATVIPEQQPSIWASCTPVPSNSSTLYFNLVMLLLSSNRFRYSMKHCWHDSLAL